MAQTTQYGLPSKHIAGDSLTWSESAPDGADDDASLRAKYLFRHLDTGKTFEAEGTAGASSWTYTLTPEETSDAPGGLYAVALLIEGDGTRTTQDAGTITLREPFDRPIKETHAAKMVRLLEAHIEGRIDEERGRGIETYTINGVPITKLTHSEARDLLERYRIDLNREREGRRSEMGLSNGRRIVAHFTNS